MNAQISRQALSLSLAFLAVSAFPASAAEAPKAYVKTWSCSEAGCPTMADKLAAQAAAQSWLDGLGEGGFHMDSANDSAEYEDKTIKREGYPDFRIINIHAYGGEWPNTLHFNAPVSSSMSVEEIQKAVQSFSHDGFPVPALAREHWRITARTPTSHVESGVTILEVAPGLLKFSVRTEFFAVYGLDDRANVMADAATPPEAYFQIEQKFTGEAVVTYKIKGF